MPDMPLPGFPMERQAKEAASSETRDQERRLMTTEPQKKAVSLAFSVKTSLGMLNFFVSHSPLFGSVQYLSHN
jgi:hypothetical protein